MRRLAPSLLLVCAPPAFAAEAERLFEAYAGTALDERLELELRATPDDSADGNAGELTGAYATLGLAWK